MDNWWIGKNVGLTLLYFWSLQDKMRECFLRYERMEMEKIMSMTTWLCIPLESHRSLGGLESEFPLPIPEFQKLASENCAKILGRKVIN